MGGLVDQELTLASGKQKEKSCCWEGLWIGVQGLFCVPVLIFAIKCFSICLTY